VTTLHNPLISGFHPDPSVVDVDGAYYLATSTFEYLPGIPIHRSTDLRDPVSSRSSRCRRRVAPGRRPSGTATGCSTS
jgi:hypothetical protein